MFPNSKNENHNHLPLENLQLLLESMAPRSLSGRGERDRLVVELLVQIPNVL